MTLSTEVDPTAAQKRTSSQLLETSVDLQTEHCQASQIDMNDEDHVLEKVLWIILSPPRFLSIRHRETQTQLSALLYKKTEVIFRRVPEKEEVGVFFLTTNAGKIRSVITTGFLPVSSLPPDRGSHLCSSLSPSYLLIVCIIKCWAGAFLSLFCLVTHQTSKKRSNSSFRRDVRDDKDQHNIVSQRGRAKLNEQVERLKELVSECRSVQMNKAAILQCVVKWIERYQVWTADIHRRIRLEEERKQELSQEQRQLFSNATSPAQATLVKPETHIAVVADRSSFGGGNSLKRGLSVMVGDESETTHYEEGPPTKRSHSDFSFHEEDEALFAQFGHGGSSFLH